MLALRPLWPCGPLGGSAQQPPAQREALRDPSISYVILEMLTLSRPRSPSVCIGVLSGDTLRAKQRRHDKYRYDAALLCDAAGGDYLDSAEPLSLNLLVRTTMIKAP
jgi:hypothetical protein